MKLKLMGPQSTDSTYYGHPLCTISALKNPLEPLSSFSRALFIPIILPNDL